MRISRFVTEMVHACAPHQLTRELTHVLTQESGVLTRPTLVTCKFAICLR